MTRDGDPPAGGKERRERLAAELRANLLRRKQQARSRRAGRADARIGEPGTAEGGDPPGGARGKPDGGQE